MAERALDAAGCGSMVVDLFHRTPRIIQADQKILLDGEGGGAVSQQAAVGGVVLNHLGWARVLGLRTGIFGKMADDRNGEFLRAGMDALGIRHHLTLDGGASSFATIFVDPAGNRAIYMVRGATAELKPAEIRRRHGDFIRKAHLVTTEISQLPLATVIAILTFARANSIPTVLDVDVPPADACASLGGRAELERALRLATILKPAKAAARDLAGIACRDPLKMAEKLRARYRNRAVVITDGDNGCAISAAGAAVRVPAFRVRQTDSTGAGDAFLGGMLAGLRHGLSWEAVGRLGNAAGAVCVTRIGAFPSGLELRDEILRLYGDELPIADLSFNGAAENARFDPAAEVERFFDLALAEMGALKGALDIRGLNRTVDMIRDAHARGGRVHVTGVGKPEHVARYAASLLCSVGTMATFLHATETLHGSLGQVDPKDVVIAISNSGATIEICAAARAIRDHGARLVAITGNKRSELARIADLVLHAPVDNEGGVLGLAPRISVLAQVFVIAALSVALEAGRGLTLEEYSRWHRAGTLGEAARRRARSNHRRRVRDDPGERI